MTEAAVAFALQPLLSRSRRLRYKTVACEFHLLAVAISTRRNSNEQTPVKLGTLSRYIRNLNVRFVGQMKP